MEAEKTPRNLPAIGVVETVHKCKACNSEIIAQYDAAENNFHLWCDGCKVMEFIPKPEFENFRKHFKTEIYLFGHKVRTYE